jgi:ELWxxDGT repeat protein
VNGIVYFIATDGVTGNELWKTDGTTIGTTRLTDINSGINNSVIAGMAHINGVIYFWAEDGIVGRELWKLDTSLPTGLNTNTNSTSFIIYPNPSNSIINVESLLATDELINIYFSNTLGQVILSQSISSKHTILNIQHLSSGVYFITLNQKGKTTTVKFIKE